MVINTSGSVITPIFLTDSASSAIFHLTKHSFGSSYPTFLERARQRRPFARDWRDDWSWLNCSIIDHYLSVVSKPSEFRLDDISWFVGSSQCGNGARLLETSEERRLKARYTELPCILLWPNLISAGIYHDKDRERHLTARERKRFYLFLFTPSLVISRHMSEPVRRL